VKIPLDAAQCFQLEKKEELFMCAGCVHEMEKEGRGGRRGWGMWDSRELHKGKRDIVVRL
jgi:hypothetical protein